MRLLIAAVAGFALAVVPALAADHSVTARNFEFVAGDITIAPGDSVTWTQTEGSHTLHFEGEADGVALSSPVKRTFDTPGTYRYFCDPHAPDMAGRVVVKAPETTGTTGTTTTTTTTTPTTTTTTPTTTTPPPTTTTPVTTPVVEPAVTVKVLSASRRRGVRLRIRSDRSRTLTGTLRRGGRAFGSVRLRVSAGSRVHRITKVRSGKRLSRGSYRLTLKADGAPLTVKFRVR